MSKIEFKDKKGNIEGKLEIKNQTENSADLHFYGDIISESPGEWYKNYYPDDKCPSDIKEFLDQLENVNSINIYLNSGGGSVFGGLAIYNQLKRYNATINTYIDGLAGSIASVIAMAGDTIYMPKNALFMIHKPLTWAGGNADDFKKIIELLDTCQKSILNVYMTKAKDNVTEEEINNLINAETWFTGEEAANYFNIVLEDNINIENSINDDYINKYNIPKNKLEDVKKVVSNTAYFNAKKELPVMDEATKIMIERIKKL